MASLVFFFRGFRVRLMSKLLFFHRRSFIDDPLFAVGLVPFFTACTKVYVTGLSSAHE